MLKKNDVQDVNFLALVSSFFHYYYFHFRKFYYCAVVIGDLLIVFIESS